MDKLLIVVSSPSGGGKTSVCKKLISDKTSPLYNNVQFSISATTRKMRTNETNGKDYHFLTREEFERKLKNDDFLEHANVFGNLYGTLKSEIIHEKHTIFDIDVVGYKQIQNKTEFLKSGNLGYNQNINILSFFLLPPSIEELKERLILRADLTKEEILNRIKEAEKEINSAHIYDFTIVNKTLDRTFDTICDIISSYLYKLKFNNNL
jgi:guanylate kinase